MKTITDASNKTEAWCSSKYKHEKKSLHNACVDGKNLGKKHMNNLMCSQADAASCYRKAVFLCGVSQGDEFEDEIHACKNGLDKYILFMLGETGIQKLKKLNQDINYFYFDEDELASLSIFNGSRSDVSGEVLNLDTDDLAKGSRSTSI